MPTTSTTGLYPFDPYGNSSDNLVFNELQALQTPGRDDFYFIIPKAAPFFVSSLVVRNHNSGVVYTEGEDYVVGHYFVEAMNKTGRAIAGSIRFLDRDIGGIVSLTYQTLGGEWGFDDAALLAELSNKAVNPLIRAWAQIDTLPASFPPIPHDQVVDNLVGFEDVVTAIGNIVTAIQMTEESQFTQHMLATDNPHNVNKTQVGLGNVNNFVMASATEAQEGIRSDRYMAPSTTREAIEDIAIVPLTAHSVDYGNPHQVTKTQVGLGNVENYPIATDIEAREASLTTRYVNPRGVGQALDEFYNVRLAPMLSGDPDNPTGVTKETIGLGNVENYPIATQTDMLAGTRNDRYTTPLRVWEAIDYHALIPLAQHEADDNNPHNVTPEQVGTLSTADITTLIEGRLAVGGVAYDTDRVFGMNQTTFYDTVRAETVNNALNFDGRSFTVAKDEILTGTAANATQFDGLTADEWIDEIENVVTNSLGEDGLNAGKRYDLALAQVDHYVPVVERSLVDDGDGGFIPIDPVNMVVSYRESDGTTSAYLLAVKGLTDTVTLTSLNNVPTGLTYYTTVNAENDKLTVWIQVPANQDILYCFPVTDTDSRTFYLVELLEASPLVMADISAQSPTTVLIENPMVSLTNELTASFDDATAALA